MKNKIFNFFGKKVTDNKTLLENKSFSLVANAAGETTLYVYDEIGFWGIEANDFAQALETLNGEPLTVRISSNGGSVQDGIAIYNMLRDYPGTVTTVNDSIAASIATVIFMAGNIRQSTSFSSFMTHKPMASFYGNSDELAQHAALLENFNEVLVKAYMAGGLEEETARGLIANGDKWFMGEEAVEMGFATEQVDAVQVAASVDLSQFETVPEKVLNKLNSLQSTAEPVTVADNKQTLAIDEALEMPEENTISQAEHEAALLEARKEGALEANKRHADVMALESVKGREALAETLLASDMDVEAIDKALQAAPKASAALPAAALTDTVGDLDADLDASSDEDKEVSRVEAWKKTNGYA